MPQTVRGIVKKDLPDKNGLIICDGIGQSAFLMKSLIQLSHPPAPYNEWQDTIFLIADTTPKGAAVKVGWKSEDLKYWKDDINYLKNTFAQKTIPIPEPIPPQFVMSALPQSQPQQPFQDPFQQPITKNYQQPVAQSQVPVGVQGIISNNPQMVLQQPVPQAQPIQMNTLNVPDKLLATFVEKMNKLYGEIVDMKMDVIETRRKVEIMFEKVMNVPQPIPQVYENNIPADIQDKPPVERKVPDFEF